MTKEMIISSNGHETMVAILEDDLVAEIFVERERQRGVVGNVYKGRVSKVLPGMQSSFIDLGLERDGFLYVADVVDTLEEFDKLESADEESGKEANGKAGRGAPPGPPAQPKIEDLLREGEEILAPVVVYREQSLVGKLLRDLLTDEFQAIRIDHAQEYQRVLELVERILPNLAPKVKLYTKPFPIFEEYGVQAEIDKALKSKVWLKTGGSIVINQTEALVAIDVNTGRYVGKKTSGRLEDTIVKTNLEAVKEIVREIRLRDLGGIIVLDLIDMEDRRNREKVMGALEAALRSDRAPSKALAFNEFGLVNITRKRTKQALERVLTQPCPYCTGSGMVKSVPTICYEIQAEARTMAADLEASSLTLRVHPEIATALKTREAVLVEELEQLTRKSGIIQADPTLHWEQYDIY